MFIQHHTCSMPYLVPSTMSLMVTFSFGTVVTYELIIFK
jgi:hypothetical protein